MATITPPPPVVDAPADAAPPVDLGVPASEARSAGRPFLVAGLASIGAGAIHAGAVGVHADHKQAAYVFAVLAFTQLGWGAVAVGSGRRRSIGLVGALVSGIAIGGWVLAKTTGIGFVDGLGDVEGIQWPDFLAALLALLAFVPAARLLLGGVGPAEARPPLRRSSSSAGVGIVAALALVGMATVGGHTHAGHTDGSTAHVHTGTEADAAGGHVHTAAVPTHEYDPKAPIDLSGVPGVTPTEQARAENLVAITLIRLPHFADYHVALAEGFHSIGDGFTGFEHFINWSYITDDHTLDPDHPESLVYSTAGGKRTLVSAMYMLKPGMPLDQVPDIGGSLTQFHIHDNLCFGGSPDAPTVAGLTDANGGCPGRLQKFTPAPMIHVWITKNVCGPFAALEGVGAGQVAAGQTRACDHVHGSSTGF